MKVYVLISGTAQPGKHAEARKAVAETVKYLNDKQDYVGEYEAVRPLQGPNSQLYWMCQYETLGDYEMDSDLRSKDPAWKEVFQSVNQTVDIGNITSQILCVIDA